VPQHYFQQEGASWIKKTWIRILTEIKLGFNLNQEKIVNSVDFPVANKFIISMQHDQKILDAKLIASNNNTVSIQNIACGPIDKILYEDNKYIKSCKSSPDESISIHEKKECTDIKWPCNNRTITSDGHYLINYEQVSGLLEQHYRYII